MRNWRHNPTQTDKTHPHTHAHTQRWSMRKLCGILKSTSLLFRNHVAMYPDVLRTCILVYPSKCYSSLLLQCLVTCLNSSSRKTMYDHIFSVSLDSRLRCKFLISWTNTHVIGENSPRKEKDQWNELYFMYVGTALYQANSSGDKWWGGIWSWQATSCSTNF